MVWQKFCGLIFIVFFLTTPRAWSTDNTYSEVFLKKINQRMQKVLSESIEAQVFLEEDLTEAMKTLAQASIVWESTFSLIPTVFSESAKKSISLSKYYSFKTSPLQQVVLVTEILFNIKRQLEGSRASLPLARIQLFAQKFSPLLLTEVDECSISLSPLPSLFTQSQRDELITKLVPLLESQGHFYDSTWASQVLHIQAKERTDGGCHGNNRNILELKVFQINLKKQVSELITEAIGDSCGYSTQHKEKAIKNLILKMRKTIPKCNRAFGIL